MSEFEVDGSELPKLVGYTVRIEVGPVVEGVVEEVLPRQKGGYSVKFSSITENSVWGTPPHWTKDLSEYTYNTVASTKVTVINYADPTDTYTELERFFAEILAESRFLGSREVVYEQDLRQARAVVEAMGKLVNGDTDSK